MDFEIVFAMFDLVDDMLPIRRQHIPVRPLQSLRDILKSLVELSCCGDISTLRDLSCGSKMSSTGAWIVREGRRLDWRGHWLRRAALLWRTILIGIHSSCASFSLFKVWLISGIGLI